MSDPASFRGQPLLVLAGVLCAWFGLRVALWQSSASGLDPSEIRLAEVSSSGLAGTAQGLARRPFRGPDPRRPPAPRAVAGRSTWFADSPPFRIPALPRISVSSVGHSVTDMGLVAMELAPRPAQAAVGHSLLLAAGLSQMELLPALITRPHAAARSAGVPAAAPLPAGVAPTGRRLVGSRLSADAWIMVRQDTISGVVSGRPSYGRSQAGGVLRFRLAPSGSRGLHAYVRASSALQGALERDIVAGLSARPIRQLPLRAAAEARVSQTQDGTELRPAVIVVTEIPPLRLPHDFRAEAYLQGGYVGGRFATPFADGQGRLERPVARIADTEISAGAGVWGGAQEGAARLDVGPTAAVAFRLGAARGRVAADYRFRLAGDAEPDSGPALTLSAGF
jgi:hypothetical protein